MSFLRHLCVAVRRSTAQHLHMLLEPLSADEIVAGGRSFFETIVTAVSSMALDAAPEVR